MVRRILREHGPKLLRYAGVSCVGVVAGQSLLFLFYVVFDWRAVVANTMAVAIATIPSYLLNRAWVWEKSGGHRFATEILPFWGMAFLGLILSNILVHLVEQHYGSWVLVNVANLAAFGALWIAKYVLLDRVLFRAEIVQTPVETAA
jgi:putative flippase GtrA